MKKLAKEIKYIIYKTTNLINNKYYIGKQTIIFENDTYYGSGLILKRAIKKYGKENFKKEIIQECKKDELDEMEIYWIEKLNSLIPFGYNITKGGTGGDILTNNPNKNLIKKKISNSLKGYKRGSPSKEHKLKNAIEHTGKKQSQETINKRISKIVGSWTLLSPDDTVINYGVSLTQYCKDNNLSYVLLKNNLNNKVLYHTRIVKKETIGYTLIKNS